MENKEVISELRSLTNEMSDKWKQGTIVQDSGGSIQIVLSVGNDGIFRCMNFKGDINNYSVTCHSFIANNLQEYLNETKENPIKLK